MNGDGAPARARILALVRQGAGAHAPVAHPGAPPADRPAAVAIERFERRLAAAGGELLRLESAAAVQAWLARFSDGFTSAATSPFVPPGLRPSLPAAPPEVAALGVSVAAAGAAETGSVVLDSREGRRLQLLPPVHLVWLRASALFASLGEALAAARVDGGAALAGAALAVHSGPSKSADIGGILVRGVHGPGRLVVAVAPDEVFTAAPPA